MTSTVLVDALNWSWLLCSSPLRPNS